MQYSKSFKWNVLPESPIVEQSDYILEHPAKPYHLPLKYISYSISVHWALVYALQEISLV